MSTRGDLLGEAMAEAGFSQSGLARVSGVRQPSISQFLSGKVALSDEQLDRLVACMGFRLEVIRRVVQPELTHSERRSWALHRRLAAHLTQTSLVDWEPVIRGNLARLGAGVQGEPHLRNLDRWRVLVTTGNVLGLHRVLTGLDRDAIEMREVSPMAGLLPMVERAEILREVR